MSHIFFISLLLLFSLLRPVLSIIAILVRPLVPFVKKRLNFERQNLMEESSLKFDDADYCFEVSSEGELEQVRAFIEAALSAHKKIEIIYSSPSVEKKCALLYGQHPEQVRLLRLPLLSFAPFSFLYFQSVWSWVSAKTIIFCRYDFFPELLLLRLKAQKFILVSGEIKKPNWYKIECLKFFDVIIAATSSELKNFKNLLGDTSLFYECDFRVPRIATRLNHAEATLQSRPGLDPYIDKLKSIPETEKIILGSAWASDMQVLNDPKIIERVKAKNLHILIVPHSLSDEHVKELKAMSLALFGPQSTEVVDDQNFYLDAPVVILQMGGLLCELYSLFTISYVGGGYERSIHSVLEPFFSNNIVITGPIIHRSTEIDVARSVGPGEIHVLNRPDSFYTILESIDITALNLEARKKFLSQTEHTMQVIFNSLIK